MDISYYTKKSGTNLKDRKKLKNRTNQVHYSSLVQDSFNSISHFSQGSVVGEELRSISKPIKRKRVILKI